MHDKKIVIDRKHISAKINELGKQITLDYSEKDLVVVGILTGSFIFTADLVRAIDLPMEIDFIKVASYGENTFSSGNLELVQDIGSSVTERDILVIEDIVDTGSTLVWLKEHLTHKNPRSIKYCTLIDKNERREHDLSIEYSGFTVPQGFLVGYGLDYGGKYRDLADVYELTNP